MPCPYDLVWGAVCSTADRAFCKAIQAVLCSSKQRRVRHDDVHRQRAHHFLKSSLLYEGLHESSISQFRQHPSWDAACQIHAAGTQHLQGEIACFISERGDEQVERGSREWIVDGIRQAGAHN